eukprot:CAMPEP_0115064942 /NCGR_PEP_ID=MMETSP0227-20121206/9973_1 /TAXON_ID=89957 /ORGANISM="Polarella glacialis, Strain CCMP 1383" /LENGTH=41 /DNA_ID= /DNA_START= /DNA_END= /DNA_ORIENTATION=
MGASASFSGASLATSVASQATLGAALPVAEIALGVAFADAV